MKYLNIEPGSVSPLGILNDKECVVPVFFDEDLKEYEYIAVHPNDNTATIWMKLTDLLDVILKFKEPEFSFAGKTAEKIHWLCL